MNIKTLRTLFLGCLPIALVTFSNANAITVTELSVSPYETPTVWSSTLGTVTVYAGVNKLLVDSVAMDGFCIDPFHFSASGPTAGYSAESLALAPKGGFAMGATVASEIEKLWGYKYSPGMNAADAAGLQIAIWELVGGANFKLISGNDYNAGAFIAAIQNPSYSGPVADLTALTGPGQDYVVQLASSGGTVPDGGTTAILLGGALCGLAAVGRRLQRA